MALLLQELLVPKLHLPLAEQEVVVAVLAEGVNGALPAKFITTVRKWGAKNKALGEAVWSAADTRRGNDRQW